MKREQPWTFFNFYSQTYFKMAKDLITADFPGPVLKEFGNMLIKQIGCFDR
jgi:hypothetical protein